MLQVAFETNPKAFLSRCGAFLDQNEVEHNLILSLCQSAEEKIAQGQPSDVRFSTLFNEDGFVVAAVQQGERNVVLSRSANLDLLKLAEAMAQQNTKIPGVVGPSDTTLFFANNWTTLTGQKPVEYMDQIIYSLTKVLMPQQKIEGTFRFAKEDETHIIAEWTQAFNKDTQPKKEAMTPQEALGRAEYLVGAGRVAVWDVGGQPVSQAAVAGTRNVARVNMVYTPPAQRGFGYASALVAHLSQQQIERGCRLCCLYADARNPVSNSIYRKIGYEFVGRSSMYIFENKQ